MGACFLSLARSMLGLCSANHIPGYWRNLPCDWPSPAWANSEQVAKNGPRGIYWNRRLSEIRRWISDCIHTFSWDVIIYPLPRGFSNSWWRHQMDIFSAVLDLCAGNSLEFLDLRLNKGLSKQSWGWWVEDLEYVCSKQRYYFFPKCFPRHDAVQQIYVTLSCILGI